MIIVAVILFIFVAPFATLYTIVYYLFNEKENRRKYMYRVSYTIDVLANVLGGEFFEAILSLKRREESYWGKPNRSISEAIGEEMYNNNFNTRFNWFNRLLDKVFKEENHSLTAYLKGK